jgi:hypothetical protein
MFLKHSKLFLDDDNHHDLFRFIQDEVFLSSIIDHKDSISPRLIEHDDSYTIYMIFSVTLFV